jgi:hypothetical protein
MVVGGQAEMLSRKLDAYGIADRMERHSMMFVQTQHKLVNMNVDRVVG